MQCFPYPGSVEFKGFAMDADKRKQTQTTAWQSKLEESSKFLRLLKCYPNYDISHSMGKKPANHKLIDMHPENVLTQPPLSFLSLSISVSPSLSVSLSLSLGSLSLAHMYGHLASEVSRRLSLGKGLSRWEQK